MKIYRLVLSGAVAATMFSACATTEMKMGAPAAKTVATGSAAGSASSNVNTALERCAEPLGTVSFIEDENAGWFRTLQGQYKLPPSATLLKLLVQQSNCFVVVGRSAAVMRNKGLETELDRSGELRAGSKTSRKTGGLGVVAADYAIQPEIIFSESDTGGLAAGVGGLVGGFGGAVLGSVAGGLKTREASTLLTLTDNRSLVQIGVSEGSASKTDWNLMGGILGGTAGGGGAAGAGAYSRTPQGKVLAAAFMDSYNQLVQSLRNYKAQTVKGGLGKGGRLKVGN